MGELRCLPAWCPTLRAGGTSIFHHDAHVLSTLSCPSSISPEQKFCDPCNGKGVHMYKGGVEIHETPSQVAAAASGEKPKWAQTVQ